MIPYSRQNIFRADVAAVSRVLRSAYLTQGPAIERFERALAKKVKSRYAIAFSSGTAALHAAYFAAGLKKGDEAIVPAMTFAATANAALYLGAKPVFCDIDPVSGLIDVKDAEKKVTKKTKLIIGVDYAGRPAALDELRKIARKRKLVFIEDGAQSLGAQYRAKPVGTQADMTMFSFHPVKSITTGEGGAIVTDNPVFAKKLRLFRTHGITKAKEDFVREDEGGWHQEQHELGFNYRMTDIQAALGESQLKRLDTFVRSRRTLAKQYQTLFKNVPGITLPPPDTREGKSAWHLYVIQVDAKKRRKIFETLRREGIGAQVHYVPVYRHPYYERLGYKKGLCPNAERFYSRIISIPLYPTLPNRTQRRIVQLICFILLK